MTKEKRLSNIVEKSTNLARHYIFRNTELFYVYIRRAQNALNLLRALHEKQIKFALIFGMFSVGFSSILVILRHLGITK